MAALMSLLGRGQPPKKPKMIPPVVVATTVSRDMHLHDRLELSAASTYFSFPPLAPEAPEAHGTDEFVRAAMVEPGGSQRAAMRAWRDIEKYLLQLARRRPSPSKPMASPTGATERESSPPLHHHTPGDHAAALRPRVPSRRQNHRPHPLPRPGLRLRSRDPQPAIPNPLFRAPRRNPPRPPRSVPRRPNQTPPPAPATEHLLQRAHHRRDALPLGQAAAAAADPRPGPHHPRRALRRRVRGARRADRRDIPPL
ncbi:hypothetical protein B0T25DRAFT_26753 [Lasiosphaeria hispida]|uniref:Uncharacterized protein n=1 Tax=Lasiosphaeria hispida TaxID=260671 RepID=A0AAJ0HUK1_9PEZI|nr:hypothetical protein B0T25DRAFT_26753 [Lasiosphaeria hispida]